MRRRRVIAVIILTVLGFALATGLLFVWPGTDEVGDAEVVAMFSGGRGERLRLALEAVEAAGIGNLVIPNGTDPSWPDANELCAGAAGIRIHCPIPDPDTTRGEARVIAELAAEHGWERIVIVTSEYHVARARLLLGRCHQGDVTVVAANSELGWGTRLAQVAHEWLGLARALIVDRNC